MACGLCGNKNKPVKYTHTAPNGTKTPNLSPEQARAMQIRNGGTFQKQ